MILSLVTKLITTVTAIALIPFMGYSILRDYHLGQVLPVITVIFMIAIISALALSGLVKLIRRKV